MKILKKTIFTLFVVSFLLVMPLSFGQAQQGIMLSISPPLIKLTMNPGQFWASTVKVVNNNPLPITVYARVVDFSGNVKGGVQFVEKGSGGTYLSDWMGVQEGPIVLESYESKDVNFNIRVPLEAGPGGYYAAIIVSTQPGSEKAKGATINVSSSMASLILLRINGDIEESGKIVEFGTDKNIYQKSEVNFKMRFRNTGNVHLQPRGELKIFDWFGKEKASMPINQKAEFGNVLPQNEREWEMLWQGENGLTHMGKYRAELSFSFGEEAKQSDVYSAYFWLVDYRLLATILGPIIFVILLIIFFARLYIRRSIRAVQKELERSMSVDGRLVRTSQVSSKQEVTKQAKTKTNVQNSMKSDKNLGWSLLSKILVALLAIIIVVLGILIFNYFSGGDDDSATQAEPKVPVERTEEDVRANGGLMVLPPAEVIETEEATSTTEEVTATSTATSTAENLSETMDKESISIRVLNGSGIPGMATKIADELVIAGFVVGEKGNAPSFSHKVTIIEFAADKESEAKAVAEALGVDAEIKESASLKVDLQITIGKDLEK